MDGNHKLKPGKDSKMHSVISRPFGRLIFPGAVPQNFVGK